MDQMDITFAGLPVPDSESDDDAVVLAAPSPRPVPFELEEDDVDAACLRLSSAAAAPKSKAVVLTKRQLQSQALGKAWDRTVGISAGDSLSRQFLIPESKAAGGKRHKNSWNFCGMAREAYCQVGAGGARRRGDISHTARELDLLCAFARATHLAQAKAIQSQIVQPVLDSRINGLFLALHHDGTPVLMFFGALQEYLVPHARYLLKAEGKWISVPYSEYIKLQGRSARTTAGVLDVFAYKAEVHWDGGSESRHINVGPVILLQGNASTCYAAVNGIVEGLDMATIHRLCAVTKFMLIGEKPDAVKYVRRMMMFKATVLPLNCSYIPQTCAVHRIHRILALALREDHCGDTYSIGFVSKNLHKKEDIKQSMEKLVRDELIVIHAPPHQHNIDHTTSVLEHTISREEGYVRGRAVDGIQASDPKRRHKHVLEQRRLILQFLNGDIRSSRVVHYETGCCVDAGGNFDLGICKDNVCNAISTAGLLADLVPGDASKNRWGSCQTHDAAQTAGEMFHQIHSRSCANAFDSWRAGDVPDGGDDYRKFVQGKVWRTVCVTSHADYGWAKALRLWALEAIDHLWLQLQYLDESGSAILDITFEKTNPIRIAREKLADIIRQPITDGPLKCIFYHYEDAPAEQISAMTTYVRTLIGSVDAQVGEETSHTKLAPPQSAGSTKPEKY